MKNCPVCSREMKEWEENNPAHCTHLVVTKSLIDGHIHTHGELENKDAMAELLDAATLEIGLAKGNTNKVLNRKEFVFHNRQRIGDILTFTCAVRDFKNAFPDTRVNVVSTAGHIWDHNPNIDRTLVATPENTVKIGPGKLTNSSNRIDWHMCNSFRISIEDALSISIPQGESRPDIYFTEEEYNAPRVFKDPYWIICVSGEKGWGTKMYPSVKWQEVVDQNPEILFVQIGAMEDNPTRLTGKNVIDYVGKTQSKQSGVRDLFKLFLNAEGSIGLVSFHMHLSGGLYKPSVVVAGAREPVSFTRYAGHQYIATDGCLPCAVKACWHCNIDACTNLIIREETIEKKIPKCVDMIDSQDVTKAIKNYYRGGRLTLGKVSDKPKLKNVVKTPIVVPTTEEEGAPMPAPYGMTWGGGSLTDRDWKFITDTMLKYHVNTVLEFGAGLSTLLFNDAGKETITFETNQGWIDRIAKLNSKCRIILWDGKEDIKFDKQYSLAFVDGPAGGVNRELSTKLASLNSDIIIVHDANREFEKIWQDMYLKAGFEGPIKGGHRCHLWVRKVSKLTSQSLATKKEGELTYEEKIKLGYKEVPVPGLKPFIISNNGGGEVIFQGRPTVASNIPVNVMGKSLSIKLISTARGWGGCGRSIATIMKFLLRAGHKVEFIPFRNRVSCQELKVYIKDYLSDLKITENYNSLKSPCDIAMIYADDFVWEFGQQEIVDAFSNLEADRKIMMLNYRRGKVGEIPWTKNFDKYMFLNTTQEKELLKVLPGVKTKVLPPCTELNDFLATMPNYDTNLRIVRHSSQGDTKYPKDFGVHVDSILSARPDAEVLTMPGPSFYQSTNTRYKAFQRNTPPVPQFLALGNLYWYSLPVGYMDMGPRTILEAMASGLPVIADNWGGATDRVTPETGWLCDTKEQATEVIKNITSSELRQKGLAAKARASNHFIPERWIEEITNA